MSEEKQHAADGALREDAAPGACAAAPCIFDFEDGQLPAGWAPAGKIATLLVTDGTSTSGTRALDITLKSDDPAFLALDLGSAQHAAVTAQVLVLSRGDGEVDFLGLSDLTTTVPGLLLVHNDNMNQYVVELPVAGVEPIARPFTTYTPVRLEVDLVGRTYSYRLGTDPERKAPLAKGAFPAGKLNVLLGLSYATGVTKSWHVRFDDVKVEVL